MSAADTLRKCVALLKKVDFADCAESKVLWSQHAVVLQEAEAVLRDGEKPFAYFVQPSSFGPFIECEPSQVGAFAAYRHPAPSLQAVGVAALPIYERKRTAHGGGWVETTIDGYNAQADWNRRIVYAAPQPAAAPSGDAWQPIETAPQDGYMLVHEDEAIRTRMRINGEWKNLSYPAIMAYPWGEAIVGKDAERFLPAGYTLAVRDGCCEEPTHWMPIPDAPTTKE